MLIHVTATIESVSHFVIINLVYAFEEMLRTLQEGERYKMGRRSIRKETPAGIPVGVSCILKGFDVVFRVFLPQFWIEASFLRVENHMV